MLTPGVRNRPVGSQGAVTRLQGEYRLAATATGLTTVAAATSTAGHIFSARWSSTTGKRALFRYIKLDFCLSTAFTGAQRMGFDLIVARAYTASHTGGTAIDVGSTVTNTNKLRTNQDTSLFAANAMRIGGAGALTAGTHTLDANALAVAPQVWMGAVGQTMSWTALDARDDGDGVVRSPLELAQDEGFIIRNSILMGAAGAGDAVITLEWDEVTL